MLTGRGSGTVFPAGGKSAFFFLFFWKGIVFLSILAHFEKEQQTSDFLYFFLVKESMLTMVNRTNFSPGSRLLCQLEFLQQFVFFCLTDMKLQVVPIGIFYALGTFQGLVLFVGFRIL